MKRVITFLLAAVMLLSLAACGDSPAAPTEAQTPATTAPATPEAPETTAPEVQAEPLVITLKGGSLGYPNPFKHSGKGQGTIKMWHLYDALLEKDENGLIPWLATDYKAAPDGLSYTFTLREGVKWSDGQDLTIDDIIFTYNYYINNEPVVSNLYVDGEYIVSGVTDNGDGTFTIGVNDVLATNLEYISRVPIIPKHIWENIDDPFNYIGEGDCVGSGPYILTSIDEEKGEYHFEPNEYFWGKRCIDEVKYIAVSDDVLAFDNNEIDYLNAPWDLYEKYENMEGCKASRNLPFLGFTLVYNMEANEAFQDVNLRQAMAYAINRQQMVDIVFNGHGVVASAGYLPEGHAMRNENIKTYEYDVEKAKELLGGKTYSLTIKCGDSSEILNICELMKMDLAEVGITLEVVSCDNSTLRQAYSSGDYELYLSYGGGWGADADRLHSMYAGWDPETKECVYSSAIRGYYNEELYNLALEQQRTVDREARTQIVYKMQEIIAEEVPCLPLLNCYDMLVTRPEKYDGWRFVYDYNYSDGTKISFAVAE